MTTHKETEMQDPPKGYKVQVHTSFGWDDVISGVRQVTPVTTRKTAEARARRMRNQGREVRVVEVR